jgi:hypothetical protein
MRSRRTDAHRTAFCAILGAPSGRLFDQRGHPEVERLAGQLGALRYLPADFVEEKDFIFSGEA